jgi:hypothetical protein
MKRFAFAVLWCTLAVECAYVAIASVMWHAPWHHLQQPLLYIVLFGALAATRGRNRYFASFLRIALGAEFCLSVADRFGMLGLPGSGVAWGDYAHFVTYTREVNAFLPATVAPFLAAIATVGEATLACTLISGTRLTYALPGAAVILCLFGSAMVASGLGESQFFYGVFVQATGAWALSQIDASWLSVDRWLRRRGERNTVS